MQTRREYLVARGLAKAGARGKFSNDAKQALEAAMAEGVKFSDMVAAVPTPVTTTGATPVVKTSPSDSLYLSPSDFRFPEEEYKAVEVGGKIHSMRECCNTCKVSLTNHACNSPTIHGNITVSIVRR